MSTVMHAKESGSTDDLLQIAGRSYRSRLLVGTGKYRDLDETRRAIEALSLIHISEPTRLRRKSRMPSSA